MTYPPWIPERWPVVADELFIDHLDPIFVVAVGGRVGDVSGERLMEEIARHIDSRPATAKVGALYHVAAGHFPADFLRRLKQVLVTRREKLQATTVCLCYVSRSPFARAALRTIMTLARLPYPVHLCDSPEKAMSMFQRAGLPIDPVKHAAAYHARLAEKHAALLGQL